MKDVKTSLRLRAGGGKSTGTQRGRKRMFDFSLRRTSRTTKRDALRSARERHVDIGNEQAI